MKRATTALRLLATLLVVTGAFAFFRGSAAAQQDPSGSITLAVACSTVPESTTISNNTDAALDLSQFTLASIDDPQQEQIFPLTGILAPGASISFQSGAGASGSVLTTAYIYDNENASEGATLTTPFGVLTVLCTQGTNTLPIQTTGGASPSPSPAPGPMGTLELVTLYCAEGVEATQIFVFDSVEAAAAETDNDTCVPGGADFSIQPFSDPALEAIAFSVDDGGINTIELPQTHSVPHILTEWVSGAEALFPIDVDAVTKIVVLNPMAAASPAPTAAPSETPTDDTDDGTDDGTSDTTGVATTLPTTGAGPRVAVQGGNAALLLGTFGVVVLAAATHVRRRRPA